MDKKPVHALLGFVLIGGAAISAGCQQNRGTYDATSAAGARSARASTSPRSGSPNIGNGGAPTANSYGTPPGSLSSLAPGGSTSASSPAGLANNASSPGGNAAVATPSGWSAQPQAAGSAPPAGMNSAPSGPMTSAAVAPVNYAAQGGGAPMTSGSLPGSTTFPGGNSGNFHPTKFTESSTSLGGSANGSSTMTLSANGMNAPGMSAPGMSAPGMNAPGMNAAPAPTVYGVPPDGMHSVPGSATVTPVGPGQ